MMRTCLFFLFVVFSIWADEPEIIQNEATLPILTPSLQGQQIAKIRLANGLQAVLVSDPKVEQSAVNLTVMAGSWQDPEAFPGLAHFLEHMLFLGTKKYPVESEFTRYLTENDGESNAYTSGDYTSYMFSIQTAGLAEGLDRFAQFFNEPLFHPSGVGRELKAIDQEFAKGFNVEGVRLYHVLKALMNPHHPASRFNTGNSQTLEHATPEMLRQWFTDHYSANLMRLYVLSSLPIAELKKLVIESFGTIPNRQNLPLVVSEAALPKSLKGQRLYIETEKNLQILNIVWELPSETFDLMESKPAELICDVIGHEGPGSLLAQLKNEGLANKLGCGKIELGANTTLLEVEVNLTTQGLSKIDTVIERIFQTIHRVTAAPFPESLFNEYSTLLQQRYQYQQHENPFEWAMKQGSWLAREPLSTYPELSQTIRKLDQQAIDKVLHVLTPQNALYILTAPQALLPKTLDRQEKWMKINYAVESIDPLILEQWSKSGLHPKITLPTPNPWLSHDFSSEEKALYDRSQYPALPEPITLQNAIGIRTFYAPDPFYQVPRTWLKFQFQSPEIKDNKPNCVVLTDIFVKALEDRLGEMMYEAKMADLNVKIERDYSAIEITLEGFTDSLERFFPHFIEEFFAKNTHLENFEIWKEHIQKEYENTKRDMPVRQTFDYFKDYIFENYATYSQKRNAIKKINVEQFKKFSEKLFNKVYVKGAITGSLSKEQALKISQLVHQQLKDKEFLREPIENTLLPLNPNKGPFFVKVASPAQGNAILLVLEVDGFSPQLRNEQQLLTSTLHDAFFAELRTKQQTGYIVSSDSLDLQKHLYTFFAIQSNTHNPYELLWRNELFLELYVHNLKDIEIPQERFNSLKQALQKKIKEPPQTLELYGEQIFKLGFEIKNFGWMVARLQQLELLTYEEFTKFVFDLLNRENKKRFAVLLQGKTHSPTFDYIPMKR